MIGAARNASPVGARSSAPSRAAQLTAAGAVIARDPATMPIKRESRRVTGVLEHCS